MWVLGGMCYWVTQRSIEIRKYLRFFCSVAQVSCPEMLEKCKFIYIPHKPASMSFTPLFHLISRQAQGIKFCKKILLAAHILIISGFERPKIDNVSSNCKLCLEFNCKLACFMPYHPHWAAHERQVSSFALRPDVVSSLPMPSGLDEPYEPYTLCMQCTYTTFDRLFTQGLHVNQSFQFLGATTYSSYDRHLDEAFHPYQTKDTIFSCFQVFSLSLSRDRPKTCKDYDSRSPSIVSNY